MKYPKKTKAIDQLIAVILLWLCVLLVSIATFIIQSNSLNLNFTSDELTGFIGLKQFFVTLAAGMLLFTVAKIHGHRAQKAQRLITDDFADNVLDEVGSAFYHFGALLIVCVMAGSSGWYLAVALFFFFLGYKAKP